MAFGFLKKKQIVEVDLPHPPSPPQIPLPASDIAPIIPEHDDEFLPAIPIEAPEEPVSEELSPIEELREPEHAEMAVQEMFEPQREVISNTKIPNAVFVADDEYAIINEKANTIRSKLMEAEQHVRRLSAIKSEEEKIIEKWRSQLESAEKKLSYVDKIIARAE